MALWSQLMISVSGMCSKSTSCLMSNKNCSFKVFVCNLVLIASSAFHHPHPAQQTMGPAFGYLQCPSFSFSKLASLNTSADAITMEVLTAVPCPCRYLTYFYPTCYLAEVAFPASFCQAFHLILLSPPYFLVCN